MTNSELSVLSDAELDAVSGGFTINTNVSTITQVNAVGIGGYINQSNQALSIQTNQSLLSVWASFRNYQH
jgi:hypothetical protein